jgi:predicted KAP-like P-loop ATPase
MNTRNTLNLIDNSIIDLQLSPKHRKQAKIIPTPQSKSSVNTSSLVKQELSLSSTSSSSFPLNNPHPVSPSPSIMDETDDILELKEHRRKQLQLEAKFLEKIPTFKSPHESHVDEFLAQAEDIFNKLDYSDDIRIVKVGEKLDPALQSWFTNLKCTSNFLHGMISKMNCQIV